MPLAASCASVEMPRTEGVQGWGSGFGVWGFGVLLEECISIGCRRCLSFCQLSQVVRSQASGLGITHAESIYCERHYAAKSSFFIIGSLDLVVRILLSGIRRKCHSKTSDSDPGDAH